MVAGQVNPLICHGSQPSAPPQGLHIHVTELSSALTRAGHEVVIYTRREDSAAPERLAAPGGYELVHVPAGPPSPMRPDETASAMGEFGNFLEREWRGRPPDIAHAHYWLSGLATQLATRSLGIPVVQTFHSLGTVEHRVRERTSMDKASRDRIRLERLIARGATRMIATSSDEVFELARIGLPRTRTTVVPSGVDTEHYCTAASPVPTRARRPRLVTAGPLEPASGFDTAIEALAGIPDAELVIAAHPAPARAPRRLDEEENSRLAKIARTHGVDGRVHIRREVGRAEMPALLCSADVVVCTPWHDSSGMLALQAMACGRPVIASASGGTLDTVLDDTTGVLVPIRSPEAVAAAARRLLTDTTARATFGIAARDRVMARYTWDRVAEDTLRTYERCVPVRRTAHRTARTGVQ
ncbi:glycosyltransferase [Rhodococcus sp. NPDC047139]|uniref:glycosyltransferase n=1 Tax=Rhodococcus sp. NPDC047139 TaxID=3155141 RepID=UPI003402D2CA